MIANPDQLIGTRNILKWKRALKSKTPHIVFQFLVVCPNEHGDPLIPTIDKYSRYTPQPDGTYQIKNDF